MKKLSAQQLSPIKTVKLSSAQTTFYEGREIATDLRIGFQTEFGRFIRRALPWAGKVWEDRTWKAAEYHALYVKGNDRESFYRFVKEAFTDKSDMTASQLAVIIVVAVEEELTVDQLITKKFKWMLRYAQAASQLPAPERLRLFHYIDQADNFYAFDQELRIALSGHHVEPNAAKLLQGSTSDIRAINKFVDTVNNASSGNGNGHHKQTAVIAASLESLHLTEPDLPGFTNYSTAIHLWCDVIRALDQSFADATDAEMICSTLMPMIPRYIEELTDRERPEYEKRYSEIAQLLPKRY